MNAAPIHRARARHATKFPSRISRKKMATRRRNTSKQSARGKKPKKPAQTGKAKPRARRSPAGRAGPVNEWMELRGSPIDGLGAFAVKAIPKGTRVIEYAGQRINN